MLITQLAARGSGNRPHYHRDRAVRWVISIDTAGTASLLDRRTGDHRAGSLISVPYLVRAGQKPPPMLLVDTAEYVFGIAKDDSDKAHTTAQTRNDDYLALLQQWAESSSDPVARQVSEFFSDEGHLKLLNHLDDATEAELSVSDLVGVMIDGAWAHQRPSAIAFWVQVARARKSSGAEGLCLSCGTAGPLLKTIPDMVKGRLIPVGVDSHGRPKQGRDAALVSINTAAQGRMGAVQLVNTPVCEDCGATVMTALNDLLADPDQRRRGEDTVFTWWLRVPADTSWMDLDTPNREAVEKLLRQPHIGRPRPAGNQHDSEADEQDELDSANQFYALTLSANQSRVIVRDWIDVPVRRIKQRLADWFRDHQSTQPWEDGLHYVPLWAMVQASGRWDRHRKRYVAGSAAHGIEKDLLRCALHGGAPPPHLMAGLLHRIRNDHHVDLARVATLRLCVNRPPYRHSPEKETIMPGLDETATDPAYVWGRMFAVLETIQRTAIPDINTTIRDRYFTVAMTQPATTMRRLRSNANSHLKKLTGKDSTKPAGIALDRKLVQLTALLDRADGMPEHLDNLGQTQFIFGYDHQRAADLAAMREARSDKENAAAALTC
ncbi:type I-C CRISPR-associated protein Cas8c/Csd1 [Nocardia sp. NPDC004654]|uniref:type I-C CRISPR-associated protein Cas8c/Csd1 n=1 Tax=Nocardia sp. NPDC004654 TaxID=3154776 RepID=UPI0033ABF9F4